MRPPILQHLQDITATTLRHDPCRYILFLNILYSQIIFSHIYIDTGYESSVVKKSERSAKATSSSRRHLSKLQRRKVRMAVRAIAALALGNRSTSRPGPSDRTDGQGQNAHELLQCYWPMTEIKDHFHASKDMAPLKLRMLNKAI